jgi:hypothetical protein
MALSQLETNKSAVMAVVIVKEKSREELLVLAAELDTEELRENFAKELREQLAQITQVTINDLSLEFVQDMAGRIHSNVQHRLSLDVE